MQLGGEGGIRTHGTLTGTPHFECGAIDHSTTSPSHFRPGGELVGGSGAKRGQDIAAKNRECKRGKQENSHLPSGFFEGHSSALCDGAGGVRQSTGGLF